jgi:maltose O-acetyltransferase
MDNFFIDQKVNEIRYEIGGIKRPSFDNIERKLLYFNKIPILRSISFLRRIVFKIWGIPLSTHLDAGFFLSSPNLHLGKNVGLADTYIIAYAPIYIGDNCSFSFRNMLITSSHDMNNFSTVLAKPISIGNNVWITSNVIILGGISIGDNSVIGAGSVVTKDIPSGVFAAGNPCRVIRKINFRK